MATEAQQPYRALDTDVEVGKPNATPDPKHHDRKRDSDRLSQTTRDGDKGCPGDAKIVLFIMIATLLVFVMITMGFTLAVYSRQGLYINPWSEKMNYDAGDVVLYVDALYLATRSSMGESPNADGPPQLSPWRRIRLE